ncbi:MULTISPECIES: N-acetylmuramoyl-L-alanine amidase [Salegentibacter]|jgi:N-acetylmuramoyl-L-alanine amidase|uniref:N-acetylmuramoyl-L-alanine amidase n=1 Tax=Salegentibacter agarivorans TaxID=345907 RepID=A0A1I2MFN6_9FLAO|nr:MULTISPECIES: N-acetylmuramoyl-L-alanine amidase [Salegentibacter]APS38150.1 N-acetylmuramoyl-L-alanine amidase [Salegentibacter sp. T436]SFF89798.1 N-acetylmuramoyl-L-alanine amidase [Salegentibacter agarivorans]
MKKLIPVFYLIMALAIISCGSNPYAKTNRLHKKQAKAYGKQLQQFPTPENQKESALNYGDYWVGTTNFNLRKPNYVVIHHTAQDSLGQTLTTFTLPRTQVSSHYVIAKNGEIFHMLNDYYRAWHGGIGKWGNNTDLNSSSLGIEIDNNGKEEFTDLQINSLIELLKEIKEKYSIPDENFIGHSDIAPSRKVDPNANFPWKRLAEEGFGLWYDEAEVENLKLEAEFFKPNPLAINLNSRLNTRIPFIDKLVFPEVIPADFNVENALKIIGFNTSDLEAAKSAFKLHFIQEDLNQPFGKHDLKVLYQLHKKYL